MHFSTNYPQTSRDKKLFDTAIESSDTKIDVLFKQREAINAQIAQHRKLQQELTAFRVAYLTESQEPRVTT